MLVVFVLLCLFYVALIIVFIFGWKKLPLLWHRGTSGVGFSIIVPFKNEEENLPALIAHLKNLNYPFKEFEVIFVNDNSTDKGAKLVQSAIEKSLYSNMQLINQLGPNGLSGKKRAIHAGIARARFEYIITIDADSIMGRHWLQTYATFICDHRPDMIIGPVEMVSGSSIKTEYFALEFCSLLGATLGAAAMGIPIMCNGANLVFRKEAYEKVGGYQGNLQHASGDDIFLLHKFKQHPGVKIHPIKSAGAVVYTKTPETFMQFFRQRVRWSAKSVGYTDIATLFVGIIVAAFNIGIVVGIVGGLFSFQLLAVALLALIIKSLIDLPLLWMVLGFIRKRHLLWLYPSMAILYPFYVAFTLALSVLPSKGWR